MQLTWRLPVPITTGSTWAWFVALLLVPLAWIPGAAEWFGLSARSMCAIGLMMGALLFAAGREARRPLAPIWHLILACSSMVLVMGTLLAAKPGHAFAWILVSIHAVWTAQTYGLNAWLICAYATAQATSFFLAPDMGVQVLFTGMSYVIVGNYSIEGAMHESVATQLAREVEEGREREARLALARDLHDRLGARLTAAALQTRVARAATGADPERAQAALMRTTALLTTAAQDLAAMRATQESAPVLWGDAEWQLRQLVQDLAVAAGADVRFDSRVPADLVLSPHAWAALWSVSQSALSNVAQHARARSVSVAMESNGGQARLVIEDDGIGFDESQAGFGVTGIASRAKAMGGCATWTRRPESGTRFTLELPLASGTTA